MRLMLVGIITVFLLIGCIKGLDDIKTDITTEPNTNILTFEECKGVPEFWYGDKGIDPSKNDLWKCYDWELNGL